MMSKKRITVEIVLNSLLLMTIIRGLINSYVNLNIDIPSYFSMVLTNITYAELLCPVLLFFVVLIYLIALFHELISSHESPKFINALRLIVGVSEITIMLINFCIVVPYAGEFKFENNNFYVFLAIPLMTLLSFIPTRRDYSSFGLLYGNTGVVLYFATIIILSVAHIITVPYKFIDVYTQEYYKIIINIVIILAASSLTTSLLMLITRPREGKN